MATTRSSLDHRRHGRRCSRLGAGLVRELHGVRAVLDGHRPDDPPGRVRRPARPQRLGQEHAAADPRRPRPRTPRATIFVPDRRVGRVPGPAAAAVGERPRQRGPRPATAATPPTAGAQALDEVGLAGHEHDWPKTLSGGEAQRAVAGPRTGARARSCCCSTSRSVRSTRSRASGCTPSCQQLCARHHPAVLLVTHDVDEAIVLADRVLVLTDGVHLARRPGRRPEPSPRSRSTRGSSRAAQPAARRARRRRTTAECRTVRPRPSDLDRPDPTIPRPTHDDQHPSSTDRHRRTRRSSTSPRCPARIGAEHPRPRPPLRPRATTTVAAIRAGVARPQGRVLPRPAPRRPSSTWRSPPSSASRPRATR